MKQRLQAFFRSLQTENARVIRSSLTWRSSRRQNGVFGALWVLGTAVLVGLIVDLVQYPRDALTLSEFFFFAYYLVCTVYFFAVLLSRQLRLLTCAEGYLFREVILDRPRAQYRSVTFTVEFTDDEGQTHRTVTEPLPTIAVNYVNQPVLIAYNPQTRLTVLIRPLADPAGPATA